MAVTPFKSNDAFNMAEFNSMIGEVNTDISGVSSSVSTLSGTVSGHTSSINSLQSQVNNKAPQYQYSTSDIGAGASLTTGVLYIVYE